MVVELVIEALVALLDHATIGRFVRRNQEEFDREAARFQPRRDA